MEDVGKLCCDWEPLATSQGSQLYDSTPMIKQKKPELLIILLFSTLCTHMKFLNMYIWRRNYFSFSCNLAYSLQLCLNGTDTQSNSSGNIWHPHNVEPHLLHSRNSIGSPQWSPPQYSHTYSAASSISDNVPYYPTNQLFPELI